MEILHRPQPLPHRTHDSQQIHPLANAFCRHCPGTEVDILPIVVSRTGTPPTSTIASLTSLLTLRTDPPNKLISKTQLDIPRILAQLHLHIVQWLHHLLLIYRIKSRPTTRRTFPFCTHTRPRLTSTITTHDTLPGGGVKTPNTLWKGWI
jgi:hypothetical protein